MKKTLFEHVYEKYGLIIGKRLWCSQIEELQRACDTAEKGEKPVLSDPFVKLVFEMAISDLIWQKRMEGEEDEE